MRTKQIAALVILVVGSSLRITAAGPASNSAAAEAPVSYFQASGFGYVRPVVIDHRQVSNTDQTDFPFLVSATLPDLATVANGGKVQSSSGYDIVFTSDAAGQTLLDHEIDSYNPATGAVGFWVRIPTLSHTTDTTIYMWYGNSGVTASQENKAGVWKNAYAAVWHFGGSSLSTSDSTSNANNATNHGVVGATGKFGEAGSFDGSNNTYLDVPSSSSYKPANNLTLEGWVYLNNQTQSYPTIVSLDYNANGSWSNPYNAYWLGFYSNTSQPRFSLENAGTNGPMALPAGQWGHIVATYDGSNMTMYVNGVRVSSTPQTGAIAYGPSKDLAIGIRSPYSPGNEINGLVDEVRISTATRSADWIATEYNNQNSPSSFFQVCAATAAGSQTPPCSIQVAPSSFSFYRQVTLNHQQVPNTDQTDFPFLISTTLPDLATPANGGKVQNASGYDIVFTSDAAGQNQLDHEIDTYNPTTGAAAFWVRIPTLSHTTDTNIYMWYGSSGVQLSQENKAGVWRNGYAGVWHFGGSSLGTADSTANQNNAINHGVTGATGKFGEAGSFDGSNSTYFDIPSSNSFKPTASLTLESWVYLNSSQGSWPKIISLDSNATGSWSSPYQAYALDFYSTTLEPAFAFGNSLAATSSSSVLTGQWQHLVGTYDGSNMRVYVNGTRMNSTSQTGAIAYGTSKDLAIGIQSPYAPGSEINGLIDEARISTVARSSDWIATEYNNQSSPSTSISISLPEPGGTLPNPQVASVSPQSGEVGTQVQINGSGFGASQGNSTVSFWWSVNLASGYTNASVLSWTDTQIVAVVPSLATTGPVRVAVWGISSNTNVDFNIPGPHISSINPTSGTAGTQVTVTGVGFQAVQGGSQLYFPNICNCGSLAGATITSWSDTQIVGTVSSQAMSGPVEVHVNGIASNRDVLFTMPNPTVRSVSPSSGPVGTQVQVNGFGFGGSQGTSTIKFNGIAPNVVSWSDTQIVATVAPATTSGPVTVNVGGIGSNGGINFTVPGPYVSSVSPAYATAGTQVTVNGSGFQASQGSSGIIIGSRSPTVASWSDTKIVATLASSTVTGAVAVYVNGVSSNQDVVLTTPNPVVESVSPQSGPGGTQVTVSGTGFGATQGSSTLSIGPNPATIVSWSNTQIVATVDPSADTGSVQAYVNGVNSNTNIVFAVLAPQVTSLSPASGVVGTQVTITGANFETSRPPSSALWFNNTSASATSWSNNQIVATVPAGATTGPVWFYPYYYARDLYSNKSVIFTLPNPLITSLSPTSGAIATQVQINGSGFGATQGSSTVAFQATPAVNATVTNWSDTQITATVPPTATSGGVTVTEGGVTSKGVGFTVLAPQVTSISPTSGGVSTQVTINGANFQATQPANGHVYFNGNQATVNSWSNTQIVATVSAGTTTGAVTVTTGNMNSNVDVRLTMPNPVISGLSPWVGPVGAQLQINGSGFGATQGSSTVSFGGTNVPQSGINSWSDTQIVATVPAGIPTSSQVQVTVGGVPSNNNPSFSVGTVYLSSITPHGGLAGTQVTVNGSGFGASQGSSTLSFNNTAATSITSWTDSQIVAAVPSGATTGAVKVVSGGVSSNTNIRFTITTVVVNSVSPGSGLAGGQFQINGSGFGATQGSSTACVWNPGAYCYPSTVVSWSDTQITATDAQSSYASGPVMVTVGGTQSNTDVYYMVTPPVVTSLSPTTGPVGTQVQINGNNFGATQGSGTVTFNNQAVPPSGITSWSNTQIVVTVPSVASAGRCRLR